MSSTNTPSALPTKSGDSYASSSFQIKRTLHENDDGPPVKKMNFYQDYSESTVSPTTPLDYFHSSDVANINTSEPVAASSAEKLTFAQRQLLKMGHKEGGGLGKYGQGISEPIRPNTQLGRRGLGLTSGSKLETDHDANFVKEDPILEEKIEWLRPCTTSPPNLADLADWTQLVEIKKLEIYDETLYVDSDILADLLESKSTFDVFPKREMMNARCKANPYEALKGAIFQNRAALKAANLDHLCDYAFTNHSDSGLLYFADICAGPGGFTEYVLWKKGWRARGFGITLRNPKDGSDFKFDKFYVGAPETFEAFYGKDGQQGNGDITCPDNLEAFREHVLLNTSDEVEDKEVVSGVHFAMADGGFSVEGQENIQEILSKQLLLAQVVCALSVLRPGGHFFCKTFDVFTPFSVGIFYLLQFVFERIAICKPVTSRPANSERYFMGIGYKHTASSVDIWKHMFALNKHLVELRSEKGDIYSIVPHDVIEADKEFYLYVRKSNNHLGQIQIQALQKVVQFVKNSSLVEDRQSELRDYYLDLWHIPNEARVPPKPSNPQEKFLALLTSPQLALNDHDLGPDLASARQSIPWLLPETLATALPSIQDFRFYASSMHDCQPYLLLGTGKSFVYSSLDGLNWKKLEPGFAVELPRDTLLEAEFTTEYNGTGAGQMSSNVIYVTDALMLAGELVAYKPLRERLEMAKLFVRATTRPSLKRLIRMKVKEIFYFQELEKVLAEKLSQGFVKSAPRRNTLLFQNSEEFVPRMEAESETLQYTKIPGAFIPFSGIVFKRIVRDPWVLAVSKKNAGRVYYFNTKSGLAQFDKPADAMAGYWSTRTCAWVVRDPSQLFSTQEDCSEGITRLGMLNHLKTLAPKSSPDKTCSTPT